MRYQQMKGLALKVIPAIMLLAMVHPLAQAEGKCKGLSKSACSSNPTCSWVNGYETKAGKKVAAYCRVKSTKKQTTDEMSEGGNKPREAVKEKTQGNKENQ
jgi:hypothetical protein